MANTIKVFKDGDVWVAQKDGTARASAIRNTQKEAYLAARNIALNQGLTITVYSKGKKRVINPRDKSDEDNCFITTACVKYYGYDDDCYQLQTLRKFRDTYMLNSLKGKQLVEEYYSIAPHLVQRLETDDNKKEIFEKIFHQINQACKAIENKKFDNAKAIYKKAVSNLLKYYGTL
jgi:hypothetical protein